MFEQNMDEYLDDEVEDVKRAFDRICKSWDQQVSGRSRSPVQETVGAVGGALVTVGTAAVQGIAMLNPQRWVGGHSSADSRHVVSTMEIEDEEGGDQLSTATKDRTSKLSGYDKFCILICI